MNGYDECTNRVYADDKVYSNMVEYCQYMGLDVDLVAQYLNQNYTFEEACTEAYTGYNDKNKKIKCYGEWYSTYKNIATIYGISYTLFLKLIKTGKTPEYAVRKALRLRNENTIRTRGYSKSTRKAKNLGYHNLKDLCKANELDDLSYAILSCQDTITEDSIKEVKEKQKARSGGIVIGESHFDDVSAACKFYDLNTKYIVNMMVKTGRDGSLVICSELSKNLY